VVSFTLPESNSGLNTVIENRSFQRDLDEIVEVAGDEVSEIVRSRVLVTGGSGFIGRWLVSTLALSALQRGFKGQVVTVSRTCPEWQQRFISVGCLKHVHWDASQSLPSLGSFGHVFHAAVPASAQVNSENPALMKQIIDQGTQQLLDAFAETETRITHLSSGAVYGLQPADMTGFVEEWSENPQRQIPNSEYHRGKIRAETQLNEGAIRNHVSHARLFAFLAPFLPLDTHFAAGNFLGSALKGEPIKITGDHRTVRSYMYGVDLVVWLIRIALNGEHKRAYNVGSEIAISIGDLATRIAVQSRHHIEVQINQKISSEGPVHRYLPDVTRTRRELRLESRVSLDEAIRRTLEWGYETQ